MMNRNSKKLWQLVTLLAFDLALLILISSQTEAYAMHLGAYGERVLIVQQHLKKCGFYEGEPDGIFSLGTRSAVKKLQKSRGIEPSGKTDYETLEEAGISSRTDLCFTAEAEILARCIQFSGCISYSEMLEKGIEILEGANSSAASGGYAVNLFPDIAGESAEPSCTAYSAAVQAMRIFSQRADRLF